MKCAYCGTEYADEKKDELREHHAAKEASRLQAFTEKEEKRKADFEQQKEADTNRVIEQGKDNNAAIERAEKAAADYEEQLKDPSLDTSKAESEIEKMEKKLTFSRKQIEKLESERIPFEKMPKFKELTKDIEFLNQTVADSQSTMKEQIDQQQAEIDAVDSNIRTIDEKLATINEYDRQANVIE